MGWDSERGNVDSGARFVKTANHCGGVSCSPKLGDAIVSFSPGLIATHLATDHAPQTLIRAVIQERLSLLGGVYSVAELLRAPRPPETLRRCSMLAFTQRTGVRWHATKS